jgi:hypothetical protein
MMSLKSKRELLEVVRPRYLKANKLEKQKMLDEFTSATGYHRKHAIRVLKNQVQIQKHLKGKTKTYKTVYRGEVVQALEQIWEICGRICSKRLQPYLPEAIKVLERCKEINITKDAKELLLKISSASIQHRSLFAHYSHQVTAWLEHHQAWQPAEKPHSSTHLYRMGRRTTWVHGN